MKIKLLIISLLLCLNSYGQKLPITGLCLADILTYFNCPSCSPVLCLSSAFTASNPAYFDATYAKAGGDWLSEFRNYGPPDATIPTVTTTAIIDITDVTATGGGNVTSDGGATVTARGVCWNTSTNPTTANSHTSNGTGTGSFTSYLTSLTNNLTYYVRAYATNSVGTAYGSNVSFYTVCSRPAGIYRVVNYSTTGGGLTVNFTGSFAEACTGLSHYIYDAYTLTGTDGESVDLNVNTDVYMYYGSTGCTKFSDGYYIIEYSSISSPIYHIQGGKIVSKDICPQ